VTSWQVSESGADIALDKNGRGTLTVTVTNPGPDQDRAVLSITALDGANRDWFEVDEPQRAIAGGDSAVYVVQVLVPTGTPAGNYAFQPVAYSADRDPGETSSTGRRITFDVAEPESRPFPWWILAVIAALVAVIAVVFFLLTRGDAPSNIDPPSVSGVPTVLETLTASEGVWEDAEEFEFQWERCVGSPVETVEADGEADDALECEPIEVGVGEIYQIGNDDAGSRLRVTVTARNGDGSTQASSPPTDFVLPVPAVAFTVPSVVGLRRSEALAVLSENFQALPVLATVEATDVCDPFVLTQAPAPGTPLAQGDTVAFTVPPIKPLVCNRFGTPIDQIVEAVEFPELFLGD
jgi:hypothetical protein